LRVRIVLGVACVVVVGALALDMAGAAPRIADTDHMNPVGFFSSMLGGQELCQPQMLLPSDAQRVQVLVGTYGPPVPALAMRFVDSAGRVVSSGRIAAGALQGKVTVPIAYPHGRTVNGSLCIRAGGHRKLVIAGDIVTPGPAADDVQGTIEGGRMAVVYLRPGRESWWQLLPTLSRRMGFGKALFFGTWTLPAAALLLVGLWICVGRLLIRELT
jgi:hypothetical protein